MECPNKYEYSALPPSISHLMYTSPSFHQLAIQEVEGEGCFFYIYIENTVYQFAHKLEKFPVLKFRQV